VVKLVLSKKVRFRHQSHALSNSVTRSFEINLPKFQVLLGRQISICVMTTVQSVGDPII